LFPRQLSRTNQPTGAKLRDRQGTILKHANTLYHAMLNHPDTVIEPETKLPLYPDTPWSMWKTLGASNSYHPEVRTILDGDCIREIENGTLLIRAPLRSDFKESFADGLTLTARVARLEQEVRNLQRTIGGIDIRMALSELQAQVNQLASQTQTDPSITEGQPKE